MQKKNSRILLLTLLPVAGILSRIIKNRIENYELLALYFTFLCLMVMIFSQLNFWGTKILNRQKPFLNFIILFLPAFIILLTIHTLLAAIAPKMLLYFLNLRNIPPGTIIYLTLYRSVLLHVVCFAILSRPYETPQTEQSQKTIGLKDTLLSVYRNTIIPTQADAIAYFHLEGGIVYQNNFNRKKFTHNVPLEKLAETLDPNIFFRANRNYLINRNAVSQINKADKRKLEIQLLDEKKLSVSKAKATAFIKWLGR